MLTSPVLCPCERHISPSLGPAPCLQALTVPDADVDAPYEWHLHGGVDLIDGGVPDGGVQDAQAAVNGIVKQRLAGGNLHEVAWGRLYTGDISKCVGCGGAWQRCSGL